MKYQNRPIKIEAFQWTGGPDQTEDPEWICEAIKSGTVVIRKSPSGTLYMSLPGLKEADLGDYIIRRADGTITSQHPSEFAASWQVIPNTPHEHNSTQNENV